MKMQNMVERGFHPWLGPRRLWVLMAFCLAAGPARADGDSPAAGARGLENIILAPGFWGLAPDDFARRAGGLQFYWVSQDKAAARSQARGLAFQDLPVVEAIVRFDREGVSEAMLSFFNRGDVGGIGENEFFGKVAAVSNRVAALAAAPGREVTRREDSGPTRKSQTWVWTGSNTAYRLETAWTLVRDGGGSGRRVLPEYVNLTLRPERGQAAPGGSMAGKARAGFAVLREKIRRLPNGDVYLEVPMVDQGQKGYCAVAAAERVLRYYGLDVNQHEIAQQAKTSTAGAMGTDSKSLLAALKAMAYAADLQVRVVDKFDADDFLKQLKAYNLEAKRARAPQISLPQSGVINVAQVYARMDKSLFLKSRAKGGNAQARFSGNVQDKINSGYPLFWGVTLGFVEEAVKLPQVVGGHMRLIIGYNSRSGEILYTDSWGPGHELKRMRQPDAFAITACLYSMEP